MTILCLRRDVLNLADLLFEVVSSCTSASVHPDGCSSRRLALYHPAGTFNNEQKWRRLIREQEVREMSSKDRSARFKYVCSFIFMGGAFKLRDERSVLIGFRHKQRSDTSTALMTSQLIQQEAPIITLFTNI